MFLQSDGRFTRNKDSDFAIIGCPKSQDRSISPVDQSNVEEVRYSQNVELTIFAHVKLPDTQPPALRDT